MKCGVLVATAATDMLHGSHGCFASLASSRLLSSLLEERLACLDIGNGLGVLNREGSSQGAAPRSSEHAHTASSAQDAKQQANEESGKQASGWIPELSDVTPMYMYKGTAASGLGLMFGL